MAGTQIKLETARRPLDARLEQLHEADLDMIGGQQQGAAFDNAFNNTFDNGFSGQSFRQESASTTREDKP